LTSFARWFWLPRRTAPHWHFSPNTRPLLRLGALTAQTATVTRDGEWVSALRELTAETGVTVVVGALVLPPGAPRPRNTMLAVSGGNIVASAEKLHLYDAFGAQESAGDFSRRNRPL
jgi:predicted amidohydrolase